VSGATGRIAQIARRVAALAALSLLGACSSLPHINPDMARTQRAPQLEGSRGPLSAERSQQILDRLRASGGGTDVLGRHLALEAALSDSPLVAGNRVQLLQDGPATYDAMFAAIAAARDHINMETYILEDDEVGRRFATTLIDKQRQGVQVNLIHDSAGTFETPKAFFETLAAAGINVLEFNPINPLEAKAGWDVNQRDHRKLLITDGRTAIMGGINISSVYSGGSFSRGVKKKGASTLPWRDTDLQIDGPVVAELQKLFLETWQKQKGAPLAPRRYLPQLSRQGDEVVHAIGGSPDEPYSLIYATLISAIDNAESEILLTNAYFVPDPQLLGSLKKAVARGVDVKLVLPSATDSQLVFHAGRAHYDDLLRAGVKIFERQNVLLHAKTALIDGVWSTVGSTNLDWRSFLHNQEVNAVVLGSAFGQRMRAAFDADLAASKQVTLEQWQQRSPVERMKEAFGQLWQYWL
jgi:cardiolipin synthase A/B